MADEPEDFPPVYGQSASSSTSANELSDDNNARSAADTSRPFVVIGKPPKPKLRLVSFNADIEGSPASEATAGQLREGPK